MIYENSYFRNPMRVLLTTMVLSLLLFGCAQERPTKFVPGDNHRFAKSLFDNSAGDRLFLKSVQDVKNAGDSVPLGAAGIYLEANRLVQFEITQTLLNVRAVKLVAMDGSAEVNETGEVVVGEVLASFPITHLDVLRKQNTDGQDTHEEEVTESRRPWNERNYIKIDFTADAKASFDNVRYAIPPEKVDIDEKNGAINFSVHKELDDGSQVTVAYSFLRFQPSARNYNQKAYPRYMQTRFGFFKTPTFKFDSHGRITEKNKIDYIDRWDVSKKIVYYLSADYPNHLKGATKEVFAAWNAAWEKATGVKNLLELRENSGQTAGDLRYNLIYFDDSDGAGSLLGYGPSVTNPRTGEIIKADVFLYGGTLRRSVYSMRQWARAFEDPKPVVEETPTEAGDVLSSGPETPVQRLLKLGEGLFSRLKPTRPHTSDEAILAQFYKTGVDGSKQLRTEEIYREAHAHFHGAGAVDSPRENGEGKNLHHNIIVLDADHMSNIREGALVEELSDAELEIRIFMPLLAHEMGHNFGLRHNFMASADKKHFGKDVRSSSVMDYAFGPQEPIGPAAYDVAALKYAYGSDDPKDVNALVRENYYFCTDDEAMSSRNILCGRHDAGTNLIELGQNMLRRYQTHYEINNHRLDRAFFFGNSSSYLSRIAQYVIPMRLLYDNADAIIRYEAELRRAGQGNQAQRQAIGKLWSLLRHRIEADANSTSVIPFPVSESVMVFIDGEKLGAAVAEAATARALAFFSLQYVLDGLDPNGREKSEYTTSDFLHRDAQVLGVLQDKLLALLMLGARTGDPITGVATSLYDGMGPELTKVLRELISDTTDGDAAFFNPNLREMALSILTDELGQPGRLSAETMELIHLEPVDGGRTETLLLGKASLARKNLQQFFVSNQEQVFDMIAIQLDQMEIQAALEQSLPEEVKARLEAKLKELTEELEAKQKAYNEAGEARSNRLAKLQSDRKEINVATLTIGHKLYKTPLNLKDTILALDLNTATGDLIVDKVNFYEDRIQANNTLIGGRIATDMAKAKAALEQYPEDPSKQRAVQVYENIQGQLEDTNKILRQLVQMERQFISDLLRKYSPF